MLPAESPGIAKRRQQVLEIHCRRDDKMLLSRVEATKREVGSCKCQQSSQELLGNSRQQPGQMPKEYRKCLTQDTRTVPSSSLIVLLFLVKLHFDLFHHVFPILYLCSK